MKRLTNTSLFGNDKLVGYRTDDGVIHVNPHYENGKIAYITISTTGTRKHVAIAVTRLDETLKMLLTVRKEVNQERSVDETL